MKRLEECSVEELKEAVWHLNEGREPGGGPYGYTAEEVKRELYNRTGSALGNHEKEYANADGKCECHKCELVYECRYTGRASRLPLGAEKGALGMCPKLEGRDRE